MVRNIIPGRGTSGPPLEFQLAYATMPEPPHPTSAGRTFDRLVEIMRTLRSPDGCPWDREQTLSSLRPFLLEETYEVLDAIDRADPKALCDELGDLVFEAIFLAQLCAEENDFTITDALEAATTKLIRRHPHVFGNHKTDRAAVKTAEDVKRRWEEIKADEQQAAGRQPSLLGGIPATLPALLRAYRIGRRAATVGFDWEGPVDVMRKVEEELAEVRAAMAESRRDRVEEELGDLLFAVANLARHLGVEPEGALVDASRKFSERFGALEHRFRERGSALRDASLEEMEAEWGRVKEELGD